MSGVSSTRKRTRRDRLQWLGSKLSFSFGRPTTRRHPPRTPGRQQRRRHRARHPVRYTRTATQNRHLGVCGFPWCIRTRPATPGSSTRTRAAHVGGRGFCTPEKNDSWRLTGDAHAGEQADASGADVGSPRQGRDHSGLQTSQDRRLAAARRPGPSPQECPSTAARPRSSATDPPHCMAHAYEQAMITIPDAAFLHLFVPIGAVGLEGVGPTRHQRRRPAHRLGRSAGDSDAAIGDPDLGDARGIAADHRQFGGGCPLSQKST